MKKTLVTLSAIACISAAGTAIAGLEAGTGVNGSLHDMNYVASKIGGAAKTDEMGRVCVFCHTPHHATVVQNGENLPLWNHDLVADSTYIAYTWATPDNTTLTDGTDFTIMDAVKGPSRLCMSCHDGSIAVDEHGYAIKQAGGLNIQAINSGVDDYAGRANLHQDLSDTHPIGFDYNKVKISRDATASRGDAALTADKEIIGSNNPYATAIAYSTTPGLYNDVTRAGGKKIKDNLYGGNIMTCATCHEVHNKENATQDPWKSVTKTLTNGLGVLTAPNYFLYAKETNSLICLSCHVK
jgi:cytochrome c553